MNLQHPHFKKVRVSYVNDRNKGKLITLPSVLANARWGGQLGEGIRAGQAWINPDGTASWMEGAKTRDFGDLHEDRHNNGSMYLGDNDKRRMHNLMDRMRSPELPDFDAKGSGKGKLALTNAHADGASFGFIGAGQKGNGKQQPSAFQQTFDHSWGKGHGHDYEGKGASHGYDYEGKGKGSGVGYDYGGKGKDGGNGYDYESKGKGGGRGYDYDKGFDNWGGYGDSKGYAGKGADHGGKGGAGKWHGGEDPGGGATPAGEPISQKQPALLQEASYIDINILPHTSIYT